MIMRASFQNVQELLLKREDRHVFVMNVNSEEFGVNSILKLIKLS